MALCPRCGNKVKFSWSVLFSDRAGGAFHPELIRFTCETCKNNLTIGPLDIVFFYLVFGLPISFFVVSIPLLVFVFPIPADKYLSAPIAWLVFLLFFSAGWVYFCIRFVWWNMLVILRSDDIAAHRSKVRFLAAVMIMASAVIACSEIYGRIAHKISVLEWMRTGEIRRLQ
jgi:hypothetical protein